MKDPITNDAGEKLDYTFEAGQEADGAKDWIVVLGHGVTGNKDRPVIANTARALGAAGFDTLRFSFAGNGESDGDFRESTVTKEVGDLKSILDAIDGRYSKICYVGHSMGGAVGVLRTAQDERVKALISLAGMVDTKTFAEVEFGSETPDEGLMWEEESCPLSAAFMRDMTETVGTVAPQVEAVRVPWLLLHGRADDVVNPRDAELVKSLRGEAVDVIFVDGADHSFSAPEHGKQAAESVVSWLKMQD